MQKKAITMYNQKFILIDADDCCISWLTSFRKFAECQLNKKLDTIPNEFYLATWLDLSDKDTRELISEFNDFHEDFENLEPYRKSEIYLPLIKNELNYNIVVISACSDNPNTKLRRSRHLVKTFGNIFSEIHCVKDSPSKKQILELYTPTIWIDDHYGNAKLGMEAGHKSYLMRQPYNEKYKELDPSIQYVEDWGQVYNILKS
jgi:hypothetical protein